MKTMSIEEALSKFGELELTLSSAHTNGVDYFAVIDVNTTIVTSEWNDGEPVSGRPNKTTLKEILDGKNNYEVLITEELLPRSTLITVRLGSHYENDFPKITLALKDLK